MCVIKEAKISRLAHMQRKMQRGSASLKLKKPLIEHNKETLMNNNRTYKKAIDKHQG
jgi:hypothetical protein